MKSTGLIIAVLLVVSVIGGVLYWQFYKKSEVKPIQTTEEAIKALTESPAEKVSDATANPVQKLPETNPLEKTNPFKYQNPFK